MTNNAPRGTDHTPDLIATFDGIVTRIFWLFTAYVAFVFIGGGLLMVFGTWIVLLGLAAAGIAYYLLRDDLAERRTQRENGN